MPELRLEGARLHYTDTGGDGPPILFAHGLLWDGRMFAPQIEALRGRHRCIAFDFRGQGRSEVTRDGYDMDTLTLDAVALIGALGIAPVHFVGLSMGGFVGQRLAIRHPALLRSLTLIETSADPEPRENVARYRTMNVVARWLGLSLVAGRVMPVMFSRSFLADPARAEERAEYRRRMLGNHRVGITRAVRGVIEREGTHARLGAITTPTLIIVGDEDVATVPAKSERMHAAIRGSRLVRVPRAGHTSTLEQPAAVTAALRDFLAEAASQGGT